MGRDWVMIKTGMCIRNERCTINSTTHTCAGSPWPCLCDPLWWRIHPALGIYIFYNSCSPAIEWENERKNKIPEIQYIVKEKWSSKINSKVSRHQVPVCLIELIVQYIMQRISNNISLIMMGSMYHNTQSYYIQVFAGFLIWRILNLHHRSFKCRVLVLFYL